MHKLCSLVDKKPVRGKRVDCAPSGAPSRGGPNDRTERQRLAKEWARFRHDQVSLQMLVRAGRQIVECHCRIIYRVKDCHRSRIPCLVLPSLKMHRLSWADA